MTKWLALALGALLALGGAVSMWNGVDVIQSERGWSSVIAGAVALSGGVVTFAIFLVIRELQALRASLSMVLESEPLTSETLPPPPVRPVPVEAHAPPAEAPHVAPPVELAPQPVDHAPEPVAPPPAPKEPPPQESFDQIFPPVPVEAPPAPPVRERFRFGGTDAAIGLAAGAAAISIFGRSRSSEVEATASRPAEEATAPEVHAQPKTHEEPHAETHAEPHADALSVSDAELEETAAALRGGAVEHVAEPEAHEAPAAEPQEAEAAHEEPVAEAAAEASAEEPPVAEVDESQVSPGYAWLERALAREEGQKSPALEWLRSRPPTSLLIDQASPADEPVVEERKAEAEEPAVEAPAEAPAEQEPVQEEAAPAEASVVGRYSSGGNEYTLYSDGTIDAQTPQGLFRFESMDELRAYIEAQNSQS